MGAVSSAPRFAPSLERHALDGNTVALWRLNGNLLDESSNNYNLTETAGTIVYEGVGGPGYVAEEAPLMELGTGYGAHAYDAGLALTGAMTFMGLLKPNPVEISGIIAFGGLPDAGDLEIRNFLYQFYYNGSGQLVYLNEHGAGINVSYTATGGTVTAKQWNHVAFTRSSGGVIKMYLDGINVGTSGALTLPTGGTSSTLWVGTEGTNDIEGPCADFHLLDREMNASEISSAANRILPTWNV